MVKRFSLRTPMVAGLLFAAAASHAAAAAPGGKRIESFVLDQLSAKGRINVFVMMATEADLRSAETVKGRVARRQFVYDALTSHAARTQKGIRAFLDARGIQYHPFWINNSVYLYYVDRDLVERLAGRADVAYVRGDHSLPLVEPVKVVVGTDATDAIEWNITKVKADKVWATGNTGQDVVVANNDTGVRYTHEDLVQQYRGNNGGGSFSHDYNWWDPKSGSGASETLAPVDGIGHGSHTMGTMVGGDGTGPLTNDIGVAPGAKWIAAKGCQTNSCSDFDLDSAAEWLTCPTKLNGSSPDCSKAPDIINNSWGGGGGDPFYQSQVNAWIAAGIIPVFSAGNSGPGCNSMGSPGDYTNTISAAATNINDVLASFSSKGPGVFRKQKPDFSAPGDNVRSAWNSGDNVYAFLSGTSMAAPHISGTIALMLHAKPGTAILDLYKALRTTTVKTLGNPPDPDNCGGRNYNQYPNYIYGHGRIDAEAAVNAVAP